MGLSRGLARMSWLNPAEVNAGGEGIDGANDVEFYVPQDDQVLAAPRSPQHMALPALPSPCFTA